MATAACRRDGILATLQLSIDLGCTSLQNNQERYKRNLDRCLCKVHERIRTGHYEFTERPNGGSKTRMLRNVVEAPYRVLDQDQNTMFIYRKEQLETITSDSVALAP